MHDNRIVKPWMVLDLRQVPEGLAILTCQNTAKRPKPERHGGEQQALNEGRKCMIWGCRGG